MGHELTGLDEYHESNTMAVYDEAAYLLGDRHRPQSDDPDGSK